MRRLIPIILPLLIFLGGCNKWAYKVPTEAMEPAIKKGDTIWVDHRYYAGHPIERFDIVLFSASEHGDPHQGNKSKMVKRVIGLGGEEIQQTNGKILVNGTELKQTFDAEVADEDFGPIAIPRGEYFLMGDNRKNSYDSRFWKPPTIKASSIMGKVIEIKHN
jgi:signal peptidase I